MRVPVALRCIPVVAAFCLAGCGATGPTFPGPPKLGENEAAIVVYRPSSPVLASTWPDVYLDGEHRGWLRNGGYVMFRVPPGDHRVEARSTAAEWAEQVGDKTWGVSARAKQSYYIRLAIGGTSAAPLVSLLAPAATRPKPVVHFTDVAPEIALDELRRLRLSE